MPIQWRWAPDDSMEGSVMQSAPVFEGGVLDLPISKGQFAFVELYVGTQRIWRGWVGP